MLLEKIIESPKQTSGVDFEVHFFDVHYIQQIIQELENEKTAKLLQRDVSEIEEWISMKNLPCKQILVEEIYPKVKNFVLQDYKDCPGLHMLQSILAPNPIGGDYLPYLNTLIDKPSEVTIKPVELHASKYDFNVLVCRILQELGMVTLKIQDTPTPKKIKSVKLLVSLTETGVAYLIRDLLSQSGVYKNLDDEIIDKCISQINFAEKNF